MKKSDLKTGMRITQRNGKSAIILLGTTKGDIFSCIGTGGNWGRLGGINEDLTDSSEKSVFDIMKVEDTLYNMDFLHKYTTIWEREDKPIKGWYKNCNYPLWLCYFDGNDFVYGFNTYRNWCNTKPIILPSGSNNELANEGEVLKRLTEEGIRRGFVAGCEFNIINSKNKNNFTTINEYILRKDTFKIKTRNNRSYTIMEDGLWLKTITSVEYTMEELTEKLGHSFKIKK